MTLLDAKEIVKKIRSLRLDEAAHFILDLANQGIIRDPDKDPSPLTPSGAIPVYLKPNKKKKRRKKPGRKKGHPGKSRTIPDHIDNQAEHDLAACPHCQTPLKKPITNRKRYIEDIPQVKPVVTEHTIHGYWCPCCRKIVEPAVLHADETGWRHSGDLCWLWCFTNKKLCYYLIAPTRATSVVLKFLRRCFKGTLICDFLRVYDKIEALAKQRCFFHLFSELLKVEAKNQCEQWQIFQAQLTRLMKDSVTLWEKKAGLRLELFQRKKDNLYFRLNWLIEKEYSDKDCRRLRNRLEKYRDELFTFLEYEDVSPYNNHAEQQMRKPVLWRRRCQQNRSDRGVEAQAILMTVFRTAELQGSNPVNYVESLVKEQISKNHKTLSTKKNAA